MRDTFASDGMQRSFTEYVCERCRKRLTGDEVRRVDITVSRIPECINSPSTRFFICNECWKDSGHTVHPGEELALSLVRGLGDA